MKNPLLSRIGASVAVMAILLVGISPAAQASPEAAPAHSVAVAVPAYDSDGTGPGDHSGSSSRDVCDNAGNGQNSKLLPVQRWVDATANMHSRLDGGIMSDGAELMQRNAVENMGMASGNLMWNLGAGISTMAINFCAMNVMGGAADQIGAQIGNAMLQPTSGLLGAIVVIGFIMLLVNGMRRGTIQWKTAATKMVILGLFFFMVTSATQSTGGGMTRYDPEGRAYTDKGNYIPHVGSPGWLITTMNTVVGSLSAAPAAALNLSEKAAVAPTHDPMDCESYTATLQKQYMDQYGGPGKAMSSGVPLILSSMWETTGLATWRTAQFNSMGAGGTGGMDRNVWCHMLEWNAGSPITIAQGDGSVQSIVTAIAGDKAPTDGSEAWKSSAFTPSDNVRKDHSAVAWAECQWDQNTPMDQGGYSLSHWFKLNLKDDAARADACRKFMGTDSDPLDAFDFPSNGNDANSKTQDNPALRTFIRTLHGNDNASGITAVLAYNIAALGMLVVFGLIGGGIIVAKVAMVLMIIATFFVLLMALAPNADTAKLGGFIKTLLGMNMFIFTTQLVFAFIAVFTKLLQQIGNIMLGGETSLFATFWSGCSPLLAVLVMHMMFIKILKVPSPFTLSGGMAWGSMMGGAMGGAAFAGVTSILNRGQSAVTNRARGAARGAVGGGKAALGTAVNRASGGRLAGGVARKGAADPTEAGSATGSGKGKASSSKVSASDLASKSEDGLVKIDHTALATSSVANSALTKGRMSRDERKINKMAQADERAAAIQHEIDQKEAMGIKTPTTALGKGWATAKDSLYQVGQDFKNKPIRTSAKVALGATVMASGFGAAAPLWGLGMYGAKKTVQHLHNTRGLGARAAHDARTANYRDFLKTQKEAKDKADAAAARAERQAQQSSSEDHGQKPTGSNANDRAVEENRPQGPSDPPPTVSMPTVSPPSSKQSYAPKKGSSRVNPSSASTLGPTVEPRPKITAGQ